MTDPLSLFAPELVQAIEGLVDERVKAALAGLSPRTAARGCRSLTPPSTWRQREKRRPPLEHGRIRSTYVGRRRLLHRDDLDSAPPRRRCLDGSQISYVPSTKPPPNGRWRAHRADSRRKRG